MKHQLFLLFLFIILGITSCEQNPQQMDYNSPSIVKDTIFTDQDLSRQIENYLVNFDTSQTIVLYHDSLYASRFLLHFYNENNFLGAWFKDGKRTPQNDSLCEIIRDADEYGLIANDYHLKKIDSLLQLNAEKNTTIKTIAEAEILLTDAFFTMCVHINKGRLNKDSLIREWKGELADSSLVDLFTKALHNNSIRASLESLEPKNNEYKALKNILKIFKDEFEENTNDSLFYSNFDSVKFKNFLKKKLVYQIIFLNENSIYPLRHFTSKSNIKTGEMEKFNYITFQKTIEKYLHQIEMNMECWRYYSPPSDQAYVWINIPSFRMLVLENSDTVLNSKIIVGRVENPTPILNSSIRYFLIYPYWNVPRTIATKELLPILKKNPNYLNQKNFDVLDKNKNVVTYPINWKKYTKEYFPWNLRQRIGRDNSLGILKFYFKNKYGVYIHDTNNKTLFELENRAISHGCIRLQKYLEFALYLLRDLEDEYPPSSLKFDLAQEKQKYVYLKNPLPIYTNYFTIEVNKNNQFTFLNDIYKRDEKMINSLYKKN